MKVTVDRTRCTGLGICESTQPARFEIDAEGALVILGEDVNPVDLAAVHQAVASCPTEALRIIDDVSP